MDAIEIPVVFTPENEPYLGRELLLDYDQLIISSLEQIAVIAPLTRASGQSDQQQMACQVIPQAISIGLSIRELIRQGYLFGAHLLVRPLVERAVLLLYLGMNPEEIQKWNDGWNYNDAPSLGKMFEAIQTEKSKHSFMPGWEFTSSMNSLLHGKPDSLPWNLALTEDGCLTHAVSKILNRPDLCDDLCVNVISWMSSVNGMMTIFFPGIESK